MTELMTEPEGLWDFAEEPEKTRLTKIAYAEVSALLGKEIASPINRVRLESGEWIALFCMGQPSWTGKGKTGLQPERVDRLGEINKARPVLMAFCEGYGAWAWEWLTNLENEGPADVIVRENVLREQWRFGWFKRRLVGGGDATNRPLTLPTHVPEPKEFAAERLIPR